jgi:hypothetical protein
MASLALAAALLGSQAFAGAGPSDPEPTAAARATPRPATAAPTTEPASVTTTTAAPSDTSDATEPTTRATEDTVVDRATPTPPRFEDLRLRCEGIARDPGPGVACRWSASHHPRFAGYRLVRGDGEQRTVVFRTRDVEVVRHLDTTVELGQRYRYVIQVLDAHGNVIGDGGPAVAGVPKPPRQEMRFACERASDGEHRGIACRWGEADGPVRGYVLYRSIDHGPREAIYRTGPDGRLGHVDAPLRPGHRYTYAVVALDGDGEVIGQGGPITIGIPPPEPTTGDPRTG